MAVRVPLLAEPSRCPVSEFVGTCARVVPTGWALQYRHMLEHPPAILRLNSCSLWEAHAGSVWEGWHAVGGTHMEQGSHEVTLKEQQKLSIMN